MAVGRRIRRAGAAARAAAAGGRHQPERREARARGLRRHGRASGLVRRRRIRNRHAHSGSGSASARSGTGTGRARGVLHRGAWASSLRAGGCVVGHDTRGLDLRGGGRQRRQRANRRDAMRSDPRRGRICDAPSARPRGRARLRRDSRNLAEPDLLLARRFDRDRIGHVHDSGDRNRGKHAAASNHRACGGTRRGDRAVAHGRSDRLRDRSGDSRARYCWSVRSMRFASTIAACACAYGGIGAARR